MPDTFASFKINSFLLNAFHLRVICSSLSVLFLFFIFLIFLISVVKATTLFSKHTKAVVWGMQTRAVQGMLDFDYVCSREQPSVAAMIYPFT